MSLMISTATGTLVDAGWPQMESCDEEANLTRHRAFGATGEPGTRLIAGPPSTWGPERLASHLARQGSLPKILDRGRLLDEVASSGLVGRGGGGFPVARKLSAVASACGDPLVVVNAAESEPASAKDQTLVRLRPHTVLDGACVAAHAVGANEVVVYLHRGDVVSVRVLEDALIERADAGLPDPFFRIALGPPRYVAGESTSVVAYLEGRDAKPLLGQRTAISGVRGRPTLVQNTETIAHLSLITRHGAQWFRSAGTKATPGSSLVTLAGAVNAPGLVIEVSHQARLGEILEVCGGLPEPPRAVLVGGYGGAWANGEMAYMLPLSRDAFSAVDLPFGCGLIGVLPTWACGLAETARLLAYLARESAGQCGPCVFGLPALAQVAADIATGRATRKEVRRLRQRGAQVKGRGACHHPDGAVTLLDTALEVFADDLSHHLGHRACKGSGRSGVFQVPSREGPVVWR